MKRNEFSTVYKDQKAALLARKEAAYKTKDLKKWDIDQDKVSIPISDLINEKKLVMRYMFTKESMNLKNLRDYWGFYTFQIERELTEYANSSKKRLSECLNRFLEASNSRVNDEITSNVNLTTVLLTVGA